MSEMVLASNKGDSAWLRWRRPLLSLTCGLIGTMMVYRGLLNLFGYPGNWERLVLAPVFFGGAFGIVLMWREQRIGWWLFSVLNFFVGYWFIFVLEDVWHHHVMPHIIFSAVFLPFYPGMKRSNWLRPALSGLADRAIRLLNIRWISNLIRANPKLHAWLNGILINRIVGVARNRPHPFSTRSDYTSWASLTDRTWSGRHLPATHPKPGSAPDPVSLTDLFERPAGDPEFCPKSTCLFAAFAQYLTDGFMRTTPVKDPLTGESDEANRKRNTSNHEIDLCTLYGRTPEQTRVLRIKDPGTGPKGLLRSQQINGEEFPPFLFENDDWHPDFKCVLDPPLGIKAILDACDNPDPTISGPARKVRNAVFAVGGDRVNSVPQIAMLNTLWLREHNRLARALNRLYPSWDDDRIFETARNIVIVEFIKIVIEDYINHIAPIALPLKANPDVAWHAPWNKPNWITTEFSLLYRWHSLIPDEFIWGGQSFEVNERYFLNNLPLLGVGLKRGFEDMSSLKAGRLGPRNTPAALVGVEVDSIRHGRYCGIAPYNKYRTYLGLKPARKFEDISSDPEVQAILRKNYSSVDDVDFFVGITCEDRVKNSPLPRTILSFVALDAFSQALPNPLLSEHVFFRNNDKVGDNITFTAYGQQQIASCTSLREIVIRNIKHPEQLGFVGMTQQSWRPE